MKTYNDLINVEEFWWKKDDFKPERWWVSFYCKDCEKIVETNRLSPSGYNFECLECKWNNVVIWTYEWLKTNYKLK